jgi:hypothetical protein
MNAKSTIQKLALATFSLAALAGVAIVSSPRSAHAEDAPSTPIKTFECPSDGAAGQDLIVDSLLYWRDTTGSADLSGVRHITFTGLE